MNGLKVRCRPVEEVIREIESCGSRTISINDADFFGMPECLKEIMRCFKGRGIRWQAGVTGKLAQDDRMLELAAGERLHHVEHRLRVDLPRHAQQRA